MDKTKLEQDLATSESKRSASRNTLVAIIIALIVIAATFFFNTIFSALSEQNRRIESLEIRIETMQAELGKLPIKKERGE